MFSVILSLNCLLIPPKSNTHPFHSAVAAIRCMLLVMLKGYWNVSTDCQKWFTKSLELSLKTCSFEFLSSQRRKSIFWSCGNSSLLLSSTNKIENTSQSQPCEKSAFTIMHCTHAQLSADGEKSGDTLFSFYLRNPQVCKESVGLKPETSALFGSGRWILWTYRRKQAWG